MGLPAPDRPTTERLYAVVVPNMDLMRERKIVNAGDILRFEMEGLAAGLPPHKRVLGYDIWFEPLPRTTTRKIKRHEIERRVRERQAASGVDGASGRSTPPIGRGSTMRTWRWQRAMLAGAAPRRGRPCGPMPTSSSISAWTRWSAWSC